MGSGLLQPGHLIVILVIALIIFGPGKLPELGSSLGRGLREFKRSINDIAEPSPSEVSSVASPVERGPATAPLPAAAVTATVVSCAQCKAPAAPGTRFCTHCGQALPV